MGSNQRPKDEQSNAHRNAHGRDFSGRKCFLIVSVNALRTRMVAKRSSQQQCITRAWEVAYQTRTSKKIQSAGALLEKLR